MTDAIEIEHQAAAIMSRPMQQVIKNIRARLRPNWGFGLIFFEHSRTTAPTVWCASGASREEFVDVCDQFVKAARK